MDSNWTELELGGVINLKRGYDLPASKRKVGKIPIMSSSGINGYHNEEKVKGPGVITGRSGQLGKVFYIKDDYWPLNTTLYVEDFKNNYPKYVYYLLQTLEFEKFNAGSSVPTLNRNHVHKLKIKIPAYNIQKKIANILYMVDEKIQLNKEIVENLEEISQTLFKQWFIDFEFPNEEGKPYKSSGGEMVQSELGEIPKEWSVKHLSEDVDFLSGGTPKTKEESYWRGNIPFFTPKDAKNNLYTTTTEKSITDLGLEKCNSKLYPKNTLFITARGTVGKLALANRPMAMNQSCFALKHKDNKQFYLYNVMKNLVKEIILGANGAVFNAINLNDLKRLKYAYSNEKVIAIFENTVSKFYEKMSLLEEENQNLQQLRDTLLPKLLSGEIEIPDELEV